MREHVKAAHPGFMTQILTGNELPSSPSSPPSSPRSLPLVTCFSTRSQSCAGPFSAYTFEASSGRRQHRALLCCITDGHGDVLFYHHASQCELVIGVPVYTPTSSVPKDRRNRVIALVEALWCLLLGSYMRNEALLVESSRS